MAGRPRSVSKLLSANDVGGNGTHQAGILVPKGDAAILAFFPPLDPSVKNPRTTIRMSDGTGGSWPFNYIYYNNKFFGGTRNEYRLTGMTRFLRELGAKEGDTLVFARDDGDRYSVRLERAGHAAPEASPKAKATAATRSGNSVPPHAAGKQAPTLQEHRPAKASAAKSTKRRLTIGSGWKVISI